MIFTRRFGALRARPVFPAVAEENDQLKNHRDARAHDHGSRQPDHVPGSPGTGADEPAA